MYIDSREYVQLILAKNLLVIVNLIESWISCCLLLSSIDIKTWKYIAPQIY